MRFVAPLLMFLGLTAFMVAPGVRAEPVSFRRIVVDKTFRSEGVAVGDVNRDGRMDVFAGDVWYEAPHWKVHQVREAATYNPLKQYSDTFGQFACDLNGDGWIDMFRCNMQNKPALWFENPKGKPGLWNQHVYHCTKADAQTGHGCLHH